MADMGAEHEQIASPIRVTMPPPSVPVLMLTLSPDDIVGADFQARRFAFVFKVLRSNPTEANGKIRVPVPMLVIPPTHDMRGPVRPAARA
ncbi:MAG: hypothetical protein WDN69_33150 [Aliidongia sp.]